MLRFHEKKKFLSSVIYLRYFIEKKFFLYIFRIFHGKQFGVILDFGKVQNVHAASTAKLFFAIYQGQCHKGSDQEGLTSPRPRNPVLKGSYLKTGWNHQPTPQNYDQQYRTFPILYTIK